MNQEELKAIYNKLSDTDKLKVSTYLETEIFIPMRIRILEEAGIIKKSNNENEGGMK